MDTQNPTLSSDDDTRPYDQQDRAASANPNPNDPILHAAAPNYGEFGGVTSGESTADAPAIPGRSGANDNPDEFSEFRDREQKARRAPDNPQDQPGHVDQNQDTAAVLATHNEDNDEIRTAWADDDPRYAGGGTHNTRNESASTKDGQD